MLHQGKHCNMQSDKIFISGQVKTETKKKDLQHECKNCPLVWVRNLENYKSNLLEISGVYKQMLASKILRLQCSNRTTNEDLWERAKQRRLEQELRYRRRRWLGHTLRRSSANIIRQAFSWNPQGIKWKGRPRNTWRREMESEIKRTRETWQDLKRTALDRRAWKDVVVDLCLQVAKR
jgi:hypothetical protein